MGVLIAATREMTSAHAPRRDAQPAQMPAIEAGPSWARMSALERGLAADRDDPTFDYAAN